MITKASSPWDDATAEVLGTPGFQTKGREAAGPALPLKQDLKQTFPKLIQLRFNYISVLELGSHEVQKKEVMF